MFWRNPLSPLAHKKQESAVLPSISLHVRIQLSLDTNMEELEDVCCSLGLWCHLVWCREEWQGAEGKINLLFLTMCGTAGIDETL
jgi:hypothetical protein